LQLIEGVDIPATADVAAFDHPYLMGGEVRTCSGVSGRPVDDPREMVPADEDGMTRLSEIPGPGQNSCRRHRMLELCPEPVRDGAGHIRQVDKHHQGGLRFRIGQRLEPDAQARAHAIGMGSVGDRRHTIGKQSGDRVGLGPDDDDDLVTTAEHVQSPQQPRPGTGVDERLRFPEAPAGSSRQQQAGESGPGVAMMTGQIGAHREINRPAVSG
jgi:hypothetical protein